jgi:hypothetical protein
MARCPVTQLPVDRCDCGACDLDDSRESWREVPFSSPAGTDSEPPNAA